MTIEPGQNLAHYHLVEKIGEGGMGQVWKAVDSTLDRDVAVKILPVEFAEDVERLTRFEREAKLLASLNHPNIATIHGLHESEGVRFLAMELVAGQDLAERISAGPIPLAETLDVARQIAEALEAAHESGVVHRDLKPANVRLTPDGQVKVLDFGLAKAHDARESGQASLSVSPTVTSAGTRAGMILGTAAYMSPEQAKGHPVDRRADIWSFGVVLHEMLTGRRLFGGENVSEVLAAVLMREPDWTALPEDVPTRVRNLLRRCLRRDPRSRLRDIGDARVAIEETVGGATIDEETPPVATPAPSPRSRFLPHVLWAATVILATTVGVMISRELGPAPSVVRFALHGTTSAGPDHAAIAPDGARIAYTEARALWVRDLDRIEPRKLAESVQPATPLWSPDGTRVAYASGGQLLAIASVGGDPVTICDLSDELEAGAWGSDGVIRFALDRGPIYEVSARGGDPRATIETGDGEMDFHDLHALPDDHGVLFSVHRSGGTAAIAAGVGSDRRLVLELEDQWIGGPVYSPTGHLLYHRWPDNAGVWAVPFSLPTLEITGEPFLVAANGSWPSISSDGTLTYLAGTGLRLEELVWVDRNGELLGTIGQPQEGMWAPALAPDGRRVSISAQEKEQRSIWLHDATRGTKSRLTFTDRPAGRSRWLSDNEIVFTVDPFSSKSEILRKSVDGSTDPIAVVDGGLSSVSRDGRYVVYTSRSEETGVDLRYRTLGEGEQQDVPFLETSHDERGGRLSPDGEWLAYVSDESGRDDVYVKRFPSGAGKWLVSVEGASFVRWDKRGDRLYLYRDQAVYEVDFETRPNVTLGTPRLLFDDASAGVMLGRGFDVSADGERFLAVRRVGGDQDDAVPGITVVQDWYAEFETTSR